VPLRVDGECTTAKRANRPTAVGWGVGPVHAGVCGGPWRERRPRTRLDFVHGPRRRVGTIGSQREGYRFTVKGGVALELRLRNRARATKDIDLVLHHADADLARALERAVTTVSVGNQGFQFRRKGEPLYLENRTISVEFAVTYEGGAWTSIVVDVARAEPGEGDVELVPAIPLREATGIS
jgi:hypothetical protein